MGFFSFNRRSKYNNQKVKYDGHVFDSKKEKERYVVLKAAEEQGIITNLERQVRFEIVPALREEYEEVLKTKTITKTRTKIKAITYKADFRYYKPDTDEWVVEDVKASPKQASLDKVYILKKKMMARLKGIFIKEVYHANDLI